MNIKIAVPENKIFHKLYENYNQQTDISLYKVDENALFDLIKSNRVDIALVTPLIYAKLSKVADFRIIPENCLVADSYTELSTIYFRQNIPEIKKIASPNPNDFLTIIAKILFAEQYDIHSEIIKCTSDLEIELRNNDIVIDYGKDENYSITVDVTEEWTFQYESQLPLAFWICKAEEYPSNVREIIRKIANIHPSNQIRVEDNTIEIYDYERSGFIRYSFEKEFKDSLEFTIEHLFYHQFISDIADVKIFE